MANNLIGSFVFINLGYGVLSSIYHNNIDSEPYPETAKRIANNSTNINDPNLFDGIYKTTWLEATRKDGSDLEISIQSNGTYKLRWYTGGTNHYEGIGFLQTNNIVGSYWKV